MMTNGLGPVPKSRLVADYLAVVVAVTLPWSTSATTIGMVLWLLAFLPTFNFAELRKELLTPAGGLPILLFAWAAIGISWADTTWRESLEGLRQFDKLLYVPILLAYFRQSSTSGTRVLIAFLASCIILLALSLATALWPSLQWWQSWGPGVPAKNYITQSAEFGIAAFCLFYISHDSWCAGASRFSIATLLVALLFVFVMFFVVTSRTELVTVAVLLIVFGARLYCWKGFIYAVVAIAIIGGFAWSTSDYLRTRVETTISDLQAYKPEGEITSTGFRIDFWQESLAFIQAAPVFGHGTGSVESLFRRAAVGKSGIAGVPTSNPHNQIFAVAIQLGLVGTLILCVMWFAHLRLFMGPGPIAWFGTVIVVQNIIGSLFNTYLFDFTEGMIYVGFVGALGGARLGNRDLGEPQAKSSLAYLESFVPKTWLAR
jgi:O-antigen ligase